MSLQMPRKGCLSEAGVVERVRASDDVACPRRSRITLDVVAEGVAWFASVGSATVSMPLE